MSFGAAQPQIQKAGYQQNLFGVPARPYYDSPDRDFDLTYLSFGAGVQSTALLICSAMGWYNVPKASHAIFADTQVELEDTYRHVEVMTEWAADYGIEVRTISFGDLEKGILEGGIGRSGPTSDTLPAFTKDPDTGTLGLLNRHCTHDYKIRPIRREVRSILGLEKGQRAKGKVYVRTMLGISMDEVIRIKPAMEEWMFNAYPLIDAGLDRQNCTDIIAKAGFEVPPKSACYFCPFHSDSYWIWLRDTQPGGWQKAVNFDGKIRHGKFGVVNEVFLHRELKPLDEVDFDERLRKAGWGNECQGICGV